MNSSTKDPKFTCPRRYESYAQNAENADSYVGGKCSYCGSVEPEEFLQAVREGIEVGPTDKSYKAYLNDHQKFYFQHLNQEQRAEFIRLYNENIMRLGYPGRFYVLPYFVKRDPDGPRSE